MNKFIMIIIFGFLSICVLAGLKNCKKPPTNNLPVVSVTPITDPQIINNMGIVLPDNQHPVIVIPVATPKPIIGMNTNSNVVVSNQGNTYIAYTSKIKLGFTLEPKLIAGYNSKFIAGIGCGIFEIWRFDADVLLAYQFVDANIMIGPGVSYKITNNTSLGINYMFDKNFDKSLGVYLSLKF